MGEPADCPPVSSGQVGLDEAGTHRCQTDGWKQTLRTPNVLQKLFLTEMPHEECKSEHWTTYSSTAGAMVGAADAEPGPSFGLLKNKQ